MDISEDLLLSICEFCDFQSIKSLRFCSKYYYKHIGKNLLVRTISISPIIQHPSKKWSKVLLNSKTIIQYKLVQFIYFFGYDEINYSIISLFKRLKFVCYNSCKNIKQIILNTPSLEVVNINNCINLQEINIYSKYIETINIKCSPITRFIIHPEWTKLYSIVICSTDIKELIIPEYCNELKYINVSNNIFLTKLQIKVKLINKLIIRCVNTPLDFEIICREDDVKFCYISN